jgi:hypothetical protein
MARSTRNATTTLALLLALSACGGAPPPPPAAPATSTDPIDLLPPGPLTIVSTHEGETTSSTIDDVHFRDAKGGEHAMLLHFTSYPIAPTELTIDDKPSPQGPSWQRLGQRLKAAGLSNNATKLLICFGGGGSSC